MTKKIFFNSFLLGAAVLLICTVIFFSLQYSQTMQETYKALQGEASYAAVGLRTGGIGYLKSLENINRITWIAHDGEVLYDSEHPELTINQNQFPEVKSALEKGTGQGIRESSSGGGQTMYYAFLCGDGTILRLSRPVSALSYAFRTVTPILGTLVLVLLISSAVAFRSARSIAEPINRLNLDDLQYEEIYPELFPLVDRLKEQRETIEREAEEREWIRREFSANVSHELKTPLTSISGFAELMSSGLCDEEKMIEFAGDIYRESQRVIALINDIIRISELDEGEVHDEAEEVDLLKSAEIAVRSLSHSAEKRGIKMTVAGPGEAGRTSGEEGSAPGEEGRTPGEEGSAPGEEGRTSGETEAAGAVWVSGSAHLIGEIIYNLCDNAVKYNRDGGEVNVRVWNDGRNACVTVEDTGIGIPASEQERVFERFYRVDKSHSRKIGGTGLGLSIVKHAAQFHDAAIELDSEPGRGTKITLRFPHTVESVREENTQKENTQGENINI